ncbi:DUF4148 domain-containing protein [Burkholderia ubonensis]|uniref:DUF4148 domain-containing protein n=1 Tax=Burkholderia ubonensis TaxID=101571 RepID=UPI0007C6382A|nr:DUF4148 domain-containing protein [Burkholderia ubonensis]
MKTLLITTAAALLIAPAFALAQSNESLTRADVQAELAALVASGYMPDSEASYPERIQRAQARLYAQQAAPVSSDASGSGPAPDAATESGGNVTPWWKKRVERIADDAPIYKGR